MESNENLDSEQVNDSDGIPERTEQAVEQPCRGRTLIYQMSLRAVCRAIKYR